MNRMNKSVSSLAVVLGFLTVPCFGQGGDPCADLPTGTQLKALLIAAPGTGGDAGGLFHGQGGGTNQITGGLIFFGGGVPLYKNGKIIGGLGISGDTACTDHEIAKRVRTAATLNPPGGAAVDDITYSGADGASAFTHPLC